MTEEKVTSVYPIISFLAYVVIWNKFIRPKSLSLKQERKVDLNEKFAPKDGITFYYFIRSPCARRVWLTIIEKQIKCNFVAVNLLAGEQRHPAYLAINPQGKVPAIRVLNHPTIPNCCLYESQAIVEWLEEQFISSEEIIPLYPNAKTNLFDYINVKMWQYWELTLAEEIWPLSRQQVDGVIWRFSFSRSKFLSSGPPSQASDDLFYKHKVMQIYNGEYMTENHAKRSIIRILRGFFMLEKALKQSNLNFLFSNKLTFADIAVYPRLCKMPQNGIVSTTNERKLFPNIMKYFEKLRKLPTFSNFLKEDLSIWESGIYPKFVPQWWGKYIPWWLVILIGNFRSGCYNFKRITQKSVEPLVVEKLTYESYDAIPKYYESNDDIILYFNSSQPMSIVVEATLELLGIVYTKRSIDVVLLQHLSHSYLKLMPFGELPVLIIKEKVIYGPQIIIEFLLHIYNLSINQLSNEYIKYFKELKTEVAIKFSDNPLEKAIDRRWFGWCHTAWHYQFQPLQYHLVYIPYLKSKYKTLKELKNSLMIDSNWIESKETIDYYINPKSRKELDPYIYEMKQRIETVELELQSHPESIYLCGGTYITYSDLFVLVFVCLAIEFGLEDLSLYPNIKKWRSNLLSNATINSFVQNMIQNNRMI